MSRRDFARAPFADRLLEQPLFFGQIEINHEQSTTRAQNIDDASR